MSPVVSVILPTFNEKGNIGSLLQRLDAAVVGPREFIVVDDDSPDGTADEVRESARKIEGVRLVTRKDERGLVSAIQRGIDEAGGEILVWMDCDLSMPPETVPALLECVARGGAAAAVGSRFAGKAAGGRSGGIGTAVQRRVSALANGLITVISGSDFHDWTSGFIAVKAEHLKRARLRGDYGEYFIYMIAALIAGGVVVKEVPYEWAPRNAGRSKTLISPVRMIPRIARYAVAAARAVRLLRMAKGAMSD